MAVSFQTRGFALCSELWAREMVIFISQLQDPRSQSKRRLAKPSGIGVGSWAWNLAVLTPCPALILSCRLPPGHRGAWAPHFSIQACVGDSAVTAEPTLPLSSAAPAYLSLFSKQWRTCGPGGAHPVPLSSALQVWGGLPSIMANDAKEKVVRPKDIPGCHGNDNGHLVCC